MPVSPDFQDVLTTFIYDNLPVLMNPTNALQVVVTNATTPALPTFPPQPLTPINPVTPLTQPTVASGLAADTSTMPVIVISPDILQAIQAAALNNFTDLGLPADIEEIAKAFFANLPPLTTTNTQTTTTATNIAANATATAAAAATASPGIAS